MRRLMLLTITILLTAGTATAAQYGMRAGLSLSPDQFVVGGQMDLGAAIGATRLVPNVELGFGNSLTTVAFNGGLIYDFPDTPWSLGGELGLNIADHSSGASSTDLGLSVLGDYRLGLSSGKTLILEAKLGLVDSADFKFTVGWSF